MILSKSSLSIGSIFSKSFLEMPVSVATNARLRSFFFLLSMSSLKMKRAFSNCFFDLIIASEKRSSCFEENSFLSWRYCETEEMKLAWRVWSCSAYFSFLRAS